MRGLNEAASPSSSTPSPLDFHDDESAGSDLHSMRPSTTTSTQYMTSSTTSTPLLTASLNSPPIAHNTSSSPTSVAAAKILFSSETSSNGSVDLTFHGSSKRNPEQAKPSSQMYSALLMQLRQTPSLKVDSVECSTTQRSRPVSPVRQASLSSSCSDAKKPKKSSTGSAFACPVCKKRFLRHIAMNAHFQNEHVAHLEADKVCGLCSHRAKSVNGIRIHLLKEHQIDLDKPDTCLVDDNNNFNIHHAGKTEKTGNRDTSFSKNSVKIEPIDERLHPCDLRVFSNVIKATTTTPSKRSSSPTQQLSSTSKRSRTAALKSDSTNGSDGCSGQTTWRCQDCCIVYPNQTLYFLHRGFHSDSNPWRCNGCGLECTDMFDFNTHLISVSHT